MKKGRLYHPSTQEGDDGRFIHFSNSSATPLLLDDFSAKLGPFPILDVSPDEAYKRFKTSSASGKSRHGYEKFVWELKKLKSIFVII
mmetsp:Transcript_5821/g.8574  ORF Transcript_5821/g.8574 Transcript_5821/m.8574 type:complete len:87 (+) Transcript_5821:400-660(+)